MTEKFAVTFYTQWRGLLLVPVLGMPLALLTLQATKLWAGSGGFLLYTGVLVMGFWGILWLIRKWAFAPSEVSINETAITIENLATGEVHYLPFAEIQTYRLDSEQFLLCLQNEQKVRLRVNLKLYKATGFAEMCKALQRALREARSRDVTRWE
jgi:uncharacterized membrane protein